MSGACPRLEYCFLCLNILAFRANAWFRAPAWPCQLRYLHKTAFCPYFQYRNQRLQIWPAFQLKLASEGYVYDILGISGGMRAPRSWKWAEAQILIIRRKIKKIANLELIFQARKQLLRNRLFQTLVNYDLLITPHTGPRAWPQPHEADPHR